MAKVSQEDRNRLEVLLAKAFRTSLADTETVAQLMCDKVWWVRYRAGQALLKLKGMTADHLAAVRSHLTDSYARDMLAHVSAEAPIP